MREHAGKRCGIGHRQLAMQHRGIQRRIEARLPPTREIHLEHVAGGEVVQHAAHATGEPLGFVFGNRGWRLPLRQPWQSGDGGDISQHGVTQRLRAGFRDQQHLAAGMVMQQRDRAAQRGCHRQTACGARQVQDRLDFLGHLVSQVERPAATERHCLSAIVLAIGQAMRLPDLFEMIEEPPRQRVAGQVAQLALRIAQEAFAIGDEQHVPARVLARRGIQRRRRGHRQQRVARGRHAAQRRKIKRRGDSFNQHGSWRRRPAPGIRRAGTPACRWCRRNQRNWT